MLIEAESRQQLIELPVEAIDCELTHLQQILFGFGPDPDGQTFMSALDDLQWLSKIMASHGEKHGGPLGVCAACHSQGYWLLGRPHDAGSPAVGDDH
jgi:hypothetical protein